MALPHDDEIKEYLRLTTDIEDDLISAINASARALVATRLKVPLESMERTFYGRWPREGETKIPGTCLVIPNVPCAATATILDYNEDEVDSSTYRIDSRTGFVQAGRYEYFINPPYTITVEVGWDHHPEYDDVVEPLLRQGIIDFAADLYRRRNPAAIYEQSGGQVSITYTENELADRTRLYLGALQSFLSTAW
jgi:hypothetical protein